jgi:hypothetical protein
MTFLSAQLNLSVNIDELGIDLLRAELFEQKKAATKWSIADVLEMANRRVRLTRRLRSIIDDRSLIYCPNIVLPVDDFSKCEFLRCEFAELRFLTYAILLIEANSTLTPPPPNHRCNIMQVLYQLIPLLIEARRHPDLEFHHVAPSLQIAFIHRCFSRFNTLSDHLSSLKFMPLRATFRLLNILRVDTTVYLPMAMANLFENIELGASLCPIRSVSCGTSLLRCGRIRPAYCSDTRCNSSSRQIGSGLASCSRAFAVTSPGRKLTS